MQGLQYRYSFWNVGHPGDCGREVQNAVSGEEADPAKCEHVSQCIWSGRGSPWRL